MKTVTRILRLLFLSLAVVWLVASHEPGQSVRADNCVDVEPGDGYYPCFRILGTEACDSVYYYWSQANTSQSGYYDSENVLTNCINTYGCAPTYILNEAVYDPSCVPACVPDGGRCDSPSDCCTAVWCVGNTCSS